MTKDKGEGSDKRPLSGSEDAKGAESTAPRAPRGRPRANAAAPRARGGSADKANRAAPAKAQAGRGYVACLFELELEVGFDGSRVERRCHIDNADSPLEEPLTVACPQ